jgi:hypothetical protein
MKIEAFLLCWNEIELMPLVIEYYKEFCDKITVMDNYSTDGSDKLAESLGCEVIKFGTKFFDDAENMQCKNNCWKNSDADWVIVCDFDEVLFSTFTPFQFSTRQYLGYYKSEGVTIIKTIGWQVMSDEWPYKYLHHETNGFEFSNYAKNICFAPKAIKEINYGPGAHECNPVGEVVWNERPMYVLHYKHIGGVQRTIDRYREYQKRMSKNNRKNGWGIHYNRTPASIRQEWNERMKKSKPLI